MTDKEKLLKLCGKKLMQHGWHKHEAYVKRLKDEIKEISCQEEFSYFLELYHEKAKYANENNLLIPYLLDITEEFDINSAPQFDYGEEPDIDIDFIPIIRTEVKEKYTKEQFGEDYVCNIATYQTFGLRNALIDMTRVFGKDRNEIIALTKKLGFKDDEGETLTWDKAIELHDDLRIYLEKNPEIAEAAQHILYRNRNIGLHASGLIISNAPIKDFVPLVKPKQEGQAASSWVEGLHGTDLGAVGLVKFDFLALDSNMKIADAYRAINSSESICALPGKGNWSDTSYLNDPQALTMANKGDLKMIFQFDGSEGIRKLAALGGVTSFDDLVAYTSLYRPSCIKHGLHLSYCHRKKGLESYQIDDLLKPILKDTYNIMIFQEQVMKILNVAGKIPLKDCEAVRKAISKKKVEKFKEYKEIFIKNAQLTLNKSEEQVKELWDFIEAFAGYSFNKSHAVAYSYISSRMLYLKCHYPAAFYSTFLSHTHPTGPKDYQKIKSYKHDIKRHEIKLHRLDINHSGINFKVINNEIYYAISRIKNIGEEAAERIVDLQPYKNYEDFLQRFGTDAKVNLALIALRAFPGDPITLYKFYESYKSYYKKITERKKRYELTLNNHMKIMRKTSNIDFTQQDYNSIHQTLSADLQEALDPIWKKVTKAQKNYTEKTKKDITPTLEKFTEPEESKLDKNFLELLQSQEACEEAYYGFAWDHPVETCAEYDFNTFEKYRVENLQIGPVEGVLKKIEKTKGPKVTYYKATLEDASGETAKITIWSKDYQQFKEKLQPGNCLRMSLSAPTPPYRTYTLAPGYKKFDYRIKVIR